VPPPGFLSLPAVCSTPRLCRLISSCCHVQGSSRSGVFSLRRATHPLRVERTPMPLLDALSPASRLPSTSTSTSRFFSLRRCVPRIWCYPPPGPLPSSGSSLLQVPSLLDGGLGLLSPRSSAHDVAVWSPVARWPPSLIYSVLPSRSRLIYL
jgi:hypothetical protein